MGNVNLNSACCDAGSPAGKITDYNDEKPTASVDNTIACCLLPIA
jgi:hypothetical protein